MNEQTDRAQRVVERFQSLLDPNQHAQLSDADYTALAGLVREAITDTLNEAADELEALTKSLRGKFPKTELGL